MAEIVSHLQHISGTTLGEFFHSLNILIKSRGESIRSNLDYILSKFEADNQLKQLARIRLIDEYQCYDEMLNVLKSDDTFYITRVLQCSWFFKNSSIQPELLVNSIFPCLSFSTRIKVLKKYSKFLRNTNVADAIFVLSKNRYGLRTAVTLLPACSQYFIEEFLKSTCFQVPVYILLPIFKSYPSVVISFISYLLEAHTKKKRVIRTFDLSVYEKIFVLIATKEPQKFSHMMEHYSDAVPYLKLGKRATRHLLHSSFDSFKNNVGVYKRIVIWKNVSANISIDQLSSIQLTEFPKTPSNFIKSFNEYSELINIVSGIKNKKVKQEMLLANFQKAYGKPVTDFSDSLTFTLVCNLPMGIAQMWVEAKISELDDAFLRGKYASYLPPDKAVIKLKKLIESESDVSMRSYLVDCLFNVVKLNEDPKLLGPLCEYFVKRLRNDRTTVKEKVIRSLAEYDKIMAIPKDSWVPIEELCNIMLLTGEASSCSDDISKIFSKRIQYNLERGLPVEELLDKLMKLDMYSYKFDLCINTPFEKQCLEWFVKWCDSKPADKLRGKIDVIFSRLCTWNLKNPSDKIQIPDRIMDSIYSIFESVDSQHYRATNILEIVRKDKELTKTFYERIFPVYIDPHIVTHELRQHPSKIKDNHNCLLSKILSSSLRSYKFFFSKARLYSTLSIPQLFIEYCLNVLQEERNEDSSYSKKRNAIVILSFMMPTREYIAVISKYYPKQSKLDDFSEEAQETLELQTEIASSFKNLNNPSQTIESLKKFAVGDYLKLIVGSLNSVLLRLPEQEVLPLLNTWLDSPVSLKKHFIRAIFKISPIQCTLEMLLRLFENEKNTSIRLLLLDNSLKFFVGEPCSETFSILKKVSEQLQSTDEEALNKLLQIDNVPDEFISEYFVLLWNEVSTKIDAHVEKRRSSIIQLIEPAILRLLSEDFCDVIISQVFKGSDKFPFDLVPFVANYLLYSDNIEQLHKRLSKIMTHLTKLIEGLTEFHLKTSHVFIRRAGLSYFIDTFVRLCLQYEDTKLSSSDILVGFSTNLLTLCKEDDILEETLLLEFSRFFLITSCRSGNMLEFSDFVAPVIDKLMSKYGNVAINSINSVISKLFAWVYSDGDDKLLDLSEILISKNVLSSQLLGISLLPTTIKSEDIDRYEKIIPSILNISDVTAKIFVNKALKELII